ncbi:hypothetical protein OH77DRAFT_1001763 [Trametes cingulata]|nr:hypothetical protein OH77DRAFT_1001763 [Trametes cingulata]
MRDGSHKNLIAEAHKDELARGGGARRPPSALPPRRRTMPFLHTRSLVPDLPGLVLVERLSSTRNGCYQLARLLGLDSSPGSEAKVVGVSLRLTKQGSIDAIAFATETLVVHVTVGPETGIVSMKEGLSRALNHPKCLLMGLHMARILLLLQRQFKLRSQGVDICETLHRADSRTPPSPGRMARDVLHKRSCEYDINALWYSHSNDDLDLRAWLTACLAEKCAYTVTQAATLKTQDLITSHLTCLSL